MPRCPIDPRPEPERVAAKRAAWCLAFPTGEIAAKFEDVRAGSSITTLLLSPHLPPPRSRLVGAKERIALVEHPEEPHLRLFAVGDERL